jgi:hypothetical protein
MLMLMFGDMCSGLQVILRRIVVCCLLSKQHAPCRNGRFNMQVLVSCAAVAVLTSGGAV